MGLEEMLMWRYGTEWGRMKDNSGSSGKYSGERWLHGVRCSELSLKSLQLKERVVTTHYYFLLNGNFCIRV